MKNVMQRIFATLGVLVLCACTVSTSGTVDAPVNKVGLKNEKPNGGTLLVIGDSIAYGVGANSESSKIDRCLARNFPKFVVVKYAQPGSTTRDARQRLANVLVQTPRVVVMSLGGNDVLFNAKISSFPAQETFDNLRFMYKELTNSGALVVHLGLNPPDARAIRLPAIQRVAEAEGVLFIQDIMDGIWNNPALLADSLHPNDQGYNIVCQRLVQELSAELN